MAAKKQKKSGSQSKTAESIVEELLSEEDRAESIVDELRSEVEPETEAPESEPENIETEPVAEPKPKAKKNKIDPETAETKPVKDEQEGREIEIVIPDAIFRKINNRSQNALLEREKIGIKENKSFLVRSSTQKDLYYEVHVVRYNDGVVHLFCSCPAGTKGSYCKHRINIVRGKRAGIQFPKTPTPDLKIIRSWLKDNPLKELVDSYVEFYEKEQEEHRKLSLTRRKLKIIKGKLSASFFGSELSSYTRYHLGEDD